MTVSRLVRLGSQIARSNFGELSLPYRLTYAVTNTCQARCVMCNIWRHGGENELSRSEVDALFAKAPHFSWINLTGGELFLRPDITDIILTIIRRTPRLYLLNFPTNGVETEAIVTTIETILARTPLPRLAVTISIDGPRNIHDEIRDLPGCWERAMDTFARLRTRRSQRFSVLLGFTLQKANSDMLEATVAACRVKIGDITEADFHVNLAHRSSHYYHNEDFNGVPAPEVAIRQLDRLEGQWSWRIDAVAFLEKQYRRLARQYLTTGKPPLICQAASASCFVASDGTVYPCSGYPVVIGSLKANGMDLHRIWNNSIRSEIREQVRDGACPGCWTPCEAYQTILANLLPGKGKQ